MSAKKKAKSAKASYKVVSVPGGVFVQGMKSADVRRAIGSATRHGRSATAALKFYEVSKRFFENGDRFKAFGKKAKAKRIPAARAKKRIRDK